jgi:hypothetical protein
MLCVTRKSTKSREGEVKVGMTSPSPAALGMSRKVYEAFHVERDEILIKTPEEWTPEQGAQFQTEFNILMKQWPSGRVKYIENLGP